MVKAGDKKITPDGEEAVSTGETYPTSAGPAIVILKGRGKTRWIVMEDDWDGWDKPPSPKRRIFA